jgi:hypothetical protein
MRLLVLPLLAKLPDPRADWTVLTEVAWVLGKVPDKQSIQPLYELDKKLQAIRNPDNVTPKKLKEAVFWAINQCDTWDQYSQDGCIRIDRCGKLLRRNSG